MELKEEIYIAQPEDLTTLYFFDENDVSIGYVKSIKRYPAVLLKGQIARQYGILSSFLKPENISKCISTNYNIGNVCTISLCNSYNIEEIVKIVADALKLPYKKVGKNEVLFKNFKPAKTAKPFKIKENKMNKYLSYKKLNEVQSAADMPEDLDFSSSEVPQEWTDAFLRWQELYAPNYDFSAEDAFMAGIRTGIKMGKGESFGF